MLEVEVKVRILQADRIPELIAKIIERGYEDLGMVIDEDLYFNHPCRDFANTDEALRIRGGERPTLTYKGPKLSAKSKTREEIVVEINDSNNMEKLLVSLGFRIVGRVYKERRKFSKGNALLTIDHVPKLGWFAELETLVESEEDFSQLERKAIDDLKRIFSEVVYIRESYLEMLLENGITDNSPRA